MINKLPLVFSDTPPDLRDPAFLALVRSAPSAGAWLRWTMLLLGAAAVGLALLGWCFYLLPGNGLRAVGLTPPVGRITTAGQVIFGIVCTLGLAALRFARRLFSDEAPYRQSPEMLRRYVLRRGEVTGFSAWMSAGGQYNRFQRVYWRSGEVNGASPYVALTLAIWLRPGDVAWIGVDPLGERPPAFLGVKRAAPQVLTSGRSDYRSLYAALEQHLAEGGDARQEKLLKVWGAGRK